MSANSEKPESSVERLARLGPSPLPEPVLEPVANPAGLPPEDRRCTGIAKGGGRCTAWAIKGEALCNGHRGDGLEAAREAKKQAAEARKEARLSVRERAAQSLDDDWPDVLEALRIGLKDGSPASRSRVAVSYVQLVYGKQLQQREDEKPTSDPLDVATLTREDREALKRQLMADHPELVEKLRAS